MSILCLIGLHIWDYETHSIIKEQDVDICQITRTVRRFCLSCSKYQEWDSLWQKWHKCEFLQSCYPPLDMMIERLKIKLMIESIDRLDQITLSVKMPKSRKQICTVRREVFPSCRNLRWVIEEEEGEIFYTTSSEKAEERVKWLFETKIRENA